MPTEKQRLSTGTLGHGRSTGHRVLADWRRLTKYGRLSADRRRLIAILPPEALRHFPRTVE